VKIGGHGYFAKCENVNHERVFCKALCETVPFYKVMLVKSLKCYGSKCAVKKIAILLLLATTPLNLAILSLILLASSVLLLNLLLIVKQIQFSLSQEILILLLPIFWRKNLD